MHHIPQSYENILKTTDLIIIIIIIHLKLLKYPFLMKNLKLNFDLINKKICIEHIFLLIKSKLCNLEN